MPRIAGRKGLPQELSEGGWPYQKLVFRLLVPRTAREYTRTTSSHLFEVLYYGSPGKLTH